ncbi:hypothetical protein CkaCkLH20_04411 [Colletotrichum karsti]|uniref:Oxidoreductase andH n=1 Tax=Colletotrichum karsti TaxID=1095194 RepID=A0A9P6I8L9_9PEZI|nr:uncharacterized protein CkaCkLH20_04411 [Colletotrichum karsti]KAF9878373.1 hypothetical protein CkaCkLH20_04411 [Colletotrichum karsti]
MSVRSLVVGGTGGIGLAIACRLAAVPTSTVIISGRNEPKDISHSNISFRSLDASSMRAIKEYAKEFISTQDDRLDFLVLTQGILTMAGRTETPEGIDRKMALHYYGRQLLIRELDSILKDDAKILIVLDGIRGSPSKLIWDDLALKTNFSLANAANHCLSMTDAMIQRYSKKNKGTKRCFIHAYPGLVRTNLFQTLPWYLRAGTQILSSVMGVPADTCAQNLLNGVNEVSARAEKDGKFWACIGQDGKMVTTKAAWNDFDLERVETHTWETIDEAISQSGSMDKN